MPRRIITEEQVAKAASLRKGGQSYRAIGKALGIDPRTAKNLAERAAAGSQHDHWEIVEQRVDTQYLEEHYQLLLYTGAGVLRAVKFHPKDAGSEVEAEVCLALQVSVALAQAGELLIGRGVEINPGLDRDIEVPAQVAQRLLEGLKEHEPTIAADLDGSNGWTKHWMRFQRSRRKLIDEASGLFAQQNCDDESAKEMAESALNVVGQRVMGNALQGRYVGQPPLPDTEASENYQSVLKQICHPERLRTLRRPGRNVAEAASRLERAVVELQIKGRPSGRCSLCPSRGGV